MAEITLPVGASAEPDTCGSCRFFDRLDDLRPVGQGRCKFKMPPGVATRYDIPGIGATVENSYQLDWIEDTGRCDLQRPDGKVYIVQRRVPPLREG
jgi:hypothetical protein